VSAESGGGTDEPYEKKVYPKSAEAKENLKKKVGFNILFSHLDEAALDEVTDAFYEESKPAGTNVIVQGDPGDNFYILDEGHCDIYVKKGNAEPVKVLDAKPGMSFGELALMYNCPRAATVTCTVPCKLWTLDRQTFNHILRSSANGADKRKEWLPFLKTVPILKPLEQGELEKLCDVMAAKSHNDGDFICRAGDGGYTLYILAEGEAIVNKTAGGDTIRTLKKGSYFGEVSLLKNVPRTANVIAQGPCKILKVAHANFVRLMEAQCKDAMLKQMATYEMVSAEDSEPVRAPRARRAGVSAESGGGTDEPYEKKVYPKSAEAKENLKKKVGFNILFSHLDEAALDEVTDAFYEESKPAGTNVIVQGDPGDNFYILDEGHCDIYVKKGNAEPVKVLDAKPGMSFGELALMYNCPRAATVTCTVPCKLWTLDRQTFNHILRSSANGADKRKEWLPFLKTVPILKPLEQGELEKLCDVMAAKSHNDGDFICRAGDGGYTLYILAEGEAIVNKTAGGDTIRTLKKGSYFGEVSLLKNVPRTANVIAQGPCKILKVAHANFVRLMEAKCKDAMLKQMATYEAITDAQVDTSAVPA